MTFHYLKFSWQEPGYLLLCFIRGFPKRILNVSISMSRDLAHFCLVQRPEQTLSRYKWLFRVEEKLTSYTFTHRKDCISYLFLLRKWMMHEIIRNSLWAKNFSIPPHSSLWRISDQVRHRFRIFTFYDRNLFFDLLQLEMSSSPLDGSLFPSESIQASLKSNFWFFFLM